MTIVWLTSSLWATGLPLLLAPATFLCGDTVCSEEEACLHSDKRTYAPGAKHTVTREFNLICETGHVVHVLELLFLAGVMVGSYFWGWAATKWGRKPVLIACQIVHCCVFFSVIFAPQFEFLYGISWVGGIAMAGLLVADVIIVSEVVDSDYRNWYAGISFSGWGLGAAGLGAFALYVDSWRTIAIAAGGLSLAVLPLLFWLDETLPYLVSVSGNRDAVEAVLKRIAYYNGTTYDPAIVSKIQVEEEPDVSVTALFSVEWICKRFVRMALIWISVVLGYYGILFCLPTYLGDIYTNAIILGLSEVPANLITSFFLNSIGRKSSSQVFFFIGAIACVTGQAAEVIDSVTLQTSALFLARFMMTALYLLIYVYTSELFPTSLRSLAMGSCTAVGNFGGMLAPTLKPLSDVLGIGPLLIISIFLFLSCGLGWGLPETRGVELGDVGKDEKEPNFNYSALKDKP